MLNIPSSHKLLRVESVRFDDGLLILAFGEIDLATVGILDTELRSAAASGAVVVDLSEVTFLGAVGMRTLLRAARAQRCRGESFKVCGLRPELRRLLGRVGILTELTSPDAPLMGTLSNGH